MQAAFLAVFLAAVVSADESLANLHARLLQANINLLDNGKGKFTCLLSQNDKVQARFRKLEITPNYSWMQNDPRVSIALEHCTAVLPASEAADQPELKADIIADGHITEAGRAIRLNLQKKARATDNSHYFTGSYVPFTVSPSHKTPISDVDVRERIGVSITCTISYCILGADVQQGGCLVGLNASIPQAA